MQINRTPLTASFLILFLVLWLISFRINSLKANFSKNEKLEYIKHFPLIKKITLIGVILFLILLFAGLILQYWYNYEVSYWSTAFFFATLWILCLTITSWIHYWIILSFKNKK